MRPHSIYEATFHLCGKVMTGETRELSCCVPVVVEWGCVTRLEADGRITEGAK